MDRHDLAYLRDSATLHFLDVSLPETVKQNKQKKKSTISKKSDKNVKQDKKENLNKNGTPEKIQKTPTITIKKKLKLPPKIIIVE